MLRAFVVALGALFLLGGVVLFAVRAEPVLAGYVLVIGVVILAGVFFERNVYRPRVNCARGRWQRTGERFVDPATNKLMEVLYNPQTGQRDYVEVKDGIGER
jgi:hypothetical protein